MKVAFYTLTRDRLDYSKHCLSLLRRKAGICYDHYVVDNGSTDGTREWLLKNELGFRQVFLAPENMGISSASNLALDMIWRSCVDYSLIVKMDNDCEIVSDNIMRSIASVFEAKQNIVLSPYVEGINRQPHRGSYEEVAGMKIGYTAIVGGLFHVVPSVLYRDYKYPEDLPKAWGQDDHFCAWVKSKGCDVGYAEDLRVNHFETTNGQCKKYPEYFNRKWKEEHV